MRIEVRVIPKAKKEKVERTKEGIKVYITQPPLKGKANRGLIGILSDYFNVKKDNIKIIRGRNSRNKLVEINEL